MNLLLLSVTTCALCVLRQEKACVSRSMPLQQQSRCLFAATARARKEVVRRSVNCIIADWRGVVVYIGACSMFDR